jgi:hypothetical protein
MSKPRLKINPRQRGRKQHRSTIAAIWLIGCERASLASHPRVDLWKGKRKFSLVDQSSAVSALPPIATAKADILGVFALRDLVLFLVGSPHTFLFTRKSAQGMVASSQRATCPSDWWRDRKLPKMDRTQ